MTFDHGIVGIYEVINGASPGNMPVEKLKKKFDSYFSFSTLGIQRYYTALQAKQQLEAVINLPDWQDVRVLDIAVLENGLQYRIQTAQPTWDENNLKITRLSLERLGNVYEYENTENP